MSNWGSKNPLGNVAQLPSSVTGSLPKKHFFTAIRPPLRISSVYTSEMETENGNVLIETRTSGRRFSRGRRLRFLGVFAGAPGRREAGDPARALSHRSLGLRSPVQPQSLLSPVRVFTPGVAGGPRRIDFSRQSVFLSFGRVVSPRGLGIRRGRAARRDHRADPPARVFDGGGARRPLLLCERRVLRGGSRRVCRG